MTHQNQSEVARLRIAILAEQEAGRRALYDFRETASHEIINAHQDKVALYFAQLQPLISEEEARALIETL